MFCRTSGRIQGSLPERLRALPGFTPPPGGWQRLEARRVARRRRFAAASGGLALAASVLVAVGLVGLRPEPAPLPAPGGPPTAATLQLIAQSQVLEERLAMARGATPVWTTGRAARAAQLEGRLMQVDAQLNYASAGDPAAERLWRDRVRLMDALVDLHQSEAPALQYASYQY